MPSKPRTSTRPPFENPDGIRLSETIVEVWVTSPLREHSLARQALQEPGENFVHNLTDLPAALGTVNLEGRVLVAGDPEADLVGVGVATHDTPPGAALTGLQANLLMRSAELVEILNQIRVVLTTGFPTGCHRPFPRSCPQWRTSESAPCRRRRGDRRSTGPGGCISTCRPSHQPDPRAGGPCPGGSPPACAGSP